MNYFILILSVTVLFFSQSTLAMGGSPPKPTGESFDTNYTQELHIDRSKGFNFDRRFMADFNGDGVKDRIHCDSANLIVFVRNGKNLKQNIFYWKGPHVRRLGNGSKRIFTGCEVLRFSNRHPSILVSTAYAHPVNGVRVPSEQFLLHNQGNRFVVKHLYAHLNGRNYRYKTASRSVKCHRYPKALVNRGYKPGFLCFFAGYDSPTPNGYGTSAALIKIEERRDGTIVGKDLTGSSGLLWSGGILGTYYKKFSTYRSETGSGKYDGLHMMDSAFLDYNSDGLVDLITVGQHSSVRASRMIIDRSKKEGIRFSTSNILTAKSGNMTEFLTIQAFNEYDKSIGRKCLLLTGEQFDYKRGSKANVHDHIRCFAGGRWRRHDFPVQYLTSEMTEPTIRKMPNGKIWIRVAQKIRKNGRTQFHRHRLFQVKK